MKFTTFFTHIMFVNTMSAQGIRHVINIMGQGRIQRGVQGVWTPPFFLQPLKPKKKKKNSNRILTLAYY